MSAEDADQVPSTPGQMTLAGQLADELRSIGAQDVSLSEHGYVFAVIPATAGCENAPALGLIAHMDTSPAISGADIHPQLVKDYDGTDICLNRELDIWLRVSEFPDPVSYTHLDVYKRQALAGRSVNEAVIRSIVEAVDIPVEIGGGIRTAEAVRNMLDLGVARVIIGTKAVERPEFMGCLLYTSRCA